MVAVATFLSDRTLDFLDFNGAVVSGKEPEARDWFGRNYERISRLARKVEDDVTGNFNYDLDS